MPRRSDTARQGLADVFYALRATMRKDRGLSGSFDRLATLSWIMLLKLVDDTDGARVNTADGWWLLRASNTQDVLVARAEAKDEGGLERLMAQIDGQLAESGIARGPQAGH